MLVKGIQYSNNLLGHQGGRTGLPSSLTLPGEPRSIYANSFACTCLDNSGLFRSIKQTRVAEYFKHRPADWLHDIADLAVVER